MKERPILFSGEMVRAILEGRKTQTRRVVKPQPNEGWAKNARAYQHTKNDDVVWASGECVSDLKFPYGKPGDRLWVRETFTLESDEDAGEFAFKPTDGRPIRHVEETDYQSGHNLIPHYKATDPKPALCCESDSCRQCEVDGEGPHWKPSIHMPRWASRITLEITNVRVERLNDISEEDARKEGVEALVQKAGGFVADGFYKAGFVMLWESINGPGSWIKNPWVWVIEFKRVKP